MMLKAADFDYLLPDELIAANPSSIRGESRLLAVSETQTRDLEFKHIIDFIQPGDLVIFNNSKVIKARLFGHKPSGGKIELLIERILPNKQVTAFVRSNKVIRPGTKINLENNFSVVVSEKMDGLFKLTPDDNEINWISYLEQFGHIPLPPYIKRSDNQDDENRYQTVYAKTAGSVASPTAGLHFTSELLTQIEAKGAQLAYVTLHVGSGTFRPVMVEYIKEHKMHSEVYSIETDVVNLIHQCKAKGGSIIAVGTTSVRTLETIAASNFTALSGETNIFITPGYEFKLVDKLITNFHLPKSTLLMLVSAFAGVETIKLAYQHAIANEYRFFSYGDACIFSKKGSAL